jgi:antitoxin component of RelBE/YafQ-DinJ toxin-antitoxin module
MEQIHTLVDKDTKVKASFVLKCKGSNISEAVKKMLEKEAKQFEKYSKGE